MMYDYEIRRVRDPYGISPAAPSPNGHIEIVKAATFDFLYNGDGDGKYPMGVVFLDEEGNRIWACFQLPQSLKRLDPPVGEEQ